jgi:hypothetical protein
MCSVMDAENKEMLLQDILYGAGIAKCNLIGGSRPKQNTSNRTSFQQKSKPIGYI